MIMSLTRSPRHGTIKYGAFRPTAIFVTDEFLSGRQSESISAIDGRSTASVLKNVRALKMMLVAGVVLSAQQVPPAGTLSIEQAVDAALRNYPSIQVSQEQINA